MQYLLIFTIVVSGIGATIAFVGALITLATAFGNKQYLWGVIIILMLPLSALYCVVYWDKAAYSGKMVIGGGALILAGWLPLFVQGWLS